jgi:hypothetical protein
LKSRSRDRINARRRERYLTEPDYAEKTRRVARERYAVNPEPRLADLRERYREVKADPEAHERRLAQNRHYMRVKGKAKQAARLADPEARERFNARRRELYAEKMANDPAWRERHRERFRIYQAGQRRAAGIPERNWAADSKRGSGQNLCVASAPFVAWLEAWLTDTGVSMSELSHRAGYGRPLSLSHLQRWPTVQVRTVGRLLDATGCSDQWHALYPTENGAEIPLLLAAKRASRPNTTVTCRSGDRCPRSAGHGPNGRFCEAHGDELERIARDLNLTLPHKQTHYARGRAAGGRASAARSKALV